MILIETKYRPLEGRPAGGSSANETPKKKWLGSVGIAQLSAVPDDTDCYWSNLAN